MINENQTPRENSMQNKYKFIQGKVEEPLRLLQTARNPQVEGLSTTRPKNYDRLKKMSKSEIDHLIYDTENTWAINVDLLDKAVSRRDELSHEEINTVQSYLNRIKQLFLKKRSLRIKKVKLRGKLLMDQQILEEQKRINEENKNYYNEKLDQFNESNDKKDSFLKQFEKKFNEVEVYIQREAKIRKRKWNYLILFDMNRFLYENEDLVRKKQSIEDETNEIAEDMNQILKENVELKKRKELIDVSQDYDEKFSKYNELTKLYKGKIKFVEMNNKHLRSVHENLRMKLETYTNQSNVRRNSLKRHRRINSVATCTFTEVNFKELEEKKIFETLNTKENFRTNKEADEDRINNSGILYESNMEYKMIKYYPLEKKFSKDRNEEEEDVWNISGIASTNN